MKRVIITKTRDNCYTVEVDDRYADGLTIDECLGCVASALFTNNPMFVKSYAADMAWKKIVGLASEAESLPALERTPR